jgi:hypothetical protein
MPKLGTTEWLMSTMMNNKKLSLNLEIMLVVCIKPFMFLRLQTIKVYHKKMLSVQISITMPRWTVRTSRKSNSGIKMLKMILIDNF